MNRRGFLAASGAAALTMGVGAASAGRSGSGVTATDHTIDSWDGTTLEATLFTPATNEPQPAILMTHGWSAFRQSPLTLPKAKHHAENGYVVLTYDSRGFGNSEGTVTLDGPNEVRDAQRLIDWLARRPEVELEGEGNPRIGMDGISYAGGIQPLTAAEDDRLDAIVPRITWNDLEYSLAPNGVIKSSWLSILVGAGSLTTSLIGEDTEIMPELVDYYWEAMRTNELPDGILPIAEERSIAAHVDQIDTPSLLVQGWNDPLFKPNEALWTYRGLRDEGVETRLAFYEGGHTPKEIVVPLDARRYMNDEATTWFDRHLRGKDVDVPEITEYLNQPDTWRTRDQFPPSDVADVTYGLGNASADGSDRIEQWSWWYDTEVTYSWDVQDAIEVVGSPTFDLTVDVDGPEGILFFNLLHNGTKINNLGEEYRIRGSGTQRVQFTHPPLQHYLEPGDELGLLITVSNPFYLNSRESDGVTIRPNESTVTLPQRSQ
jgi:predicted acyl esterase